MKPNIGRIELITRVTHNLFRGQNVKGQGHQSARPIKAITDNAPHAGRGNYNYLKMSLCYVFTTVETARLTANT